VIEDIREQSRHIISIVNGHFPSTALLLRKLIQYLWKAYGPKAETQILNGKAMGIVNVTVKTVIYDSAT